METTKYIGTAKVLDNLVEDGVVRYTLDNGLTQVATPEQFLALVADAAYDDGEISMRKWKPTVEAILQKLVDDNAQFQETGWILDRVSETTTQRANQAMAKLLKVTTKDQVTLRQLDTILKSE